MNKTTLKAFGWFLLKAFLCVIIINGVLSLLGAGVVSSFVSNPIGTAKGWFTKTPASNAATPAA